MNLDKKADLLGSGVANALHRATHSHIDAPTILSENGIVGQAAPASSGYGDMISLGSRVGPKQASEGSLRAKRLSIGSGGSLEASNRKPPGQRDGGNEKRMKQLTSRMGKIITIIIVRGYYFNVREDS